MDQKTLALIKDAANLIEHEKCYFLGSQARDDANEDSDVDLFIIVKSELTHHERLAMSAKVTLFLARHHIPSDVVIKTAQEVKIQQQVAGTISHNALAEGVLV